MTSSCLRQARATALACALPHFPKRPVQKKLAHGKSFHSTILQMRLTIPSQFKPTTSELCFRSISAHQRQFVGSQNECMSVFHYSPQNFAFVLRCLCNDVISSLLFLTTDEDGGVDGWSPARPHSPSFILVMLSFRCRPGMWIERKLWMNQQPFLISSLLSVCPPPPPSFHHLSERESESGAVAVQIMCCNPQAGWVWMTEFPYTPPPPFSSSTSNGRLDVSSLQHM